MTVGRVAFHHGTRTYSAREIASRPLGYDRAACTTGQSLPDRDRDLIAALGQADELVCAFHGKLGDSLLAFSAIAAVCDWLAQCRADRPPRIRLDGPYTHLLANSAAAFPVPPAIGPGHRAARRVVIGDLEGIRETQRWPGTTTSTVWLDPAGPPCWSSGNATFPSLADRHFLATERQLGMRLAAERPFQPTIRAPVASRVGAGALHIAAITATSWPSRKDFGAKQFIGAAEALATTLGQPTRLLLVTGQEREPAPPPAPGRGLQFDVLDAVPLRDLLPVLADCDLVVGNDTGLTHLAALARIPDCSGPQVIGLHARHAHSRWRTGLPWHHALATAFSDLMHRQDTCPVYDHIDDTEYGADADIRSITPQHLRLFAPIRG